MNLHVLAGNVKRLAKGYLCPTGSMICPKSLRRYPHHPIELNVTMPARGCRLFLLRDIDDARGEWAMICTVHNIAKLN